MPVKIKICGLRDLQNIKQVAALDPDYVGFIFYKKSKRFVGDAFSKEALTGLDSKIKRVGVFVNASFEELSAKIKDFALDAVQLHGDEKVELCYKLKVAHPQVDLIKAFGISADFSFDGIAEYVEPCDFFLFDTASKDYGGSGQSFNWDYLENYSLDVPYFLSGGLGLDNIADIKGQIAKDKRVQALDLNSKFEIEAGIKSIEQLEAFLGEFS